MTHETISKQQHTEAPKGICSIFFASAAMWWSKIEPCIYESVRWNADFFSYCRVRHLQRTWPTAIGLYGPSSNVGTWDWTLQVHFLNVRQLFLKDRWILTLFWIFRCFCTWTLNDILLADLPTGRWNEINRCLVIFPPPHQRERYLCWLCNNIVCIWRNAYRVSFSPGLDCLHLSWVGYSPMSVRKLHSLCRWI